MKRIILITLTVMLIGYCSYRIIKNNWCMTIPLSEAWQNNYCKRHWGSIYG